MTNRNRTIGCIVEGEGEREAIPILVRRFAERAGVRIEVQHLRRPRDRFIRKDLDRDVRLMAERVGQRGAILIVLDADDDLPCVLAPSLLERARAARGDRNIAVVLAKFEFEAWLLAGAESLAGKRGLPASLTAPSAPESIRDAKKWLSDRLGRKYKEVLDQPAFASMLDLELARRAPSFDKLARDMERLLADPAGASV